MHKYGIKRTSAMKTNISLFHEQLRNKENILDEDKHFAFTMNSKE